MRRCASTAALAVFLAGSATAAPADPIYTFALTVDGTKESYDEAIAAACLQGIINRDGPRAYVLSRKDAHPRYWLDVLSREGRWLHGREAKALPDLDALAKLAGDLVKGAVIWDPAVPASLNVATTIAGVEDLVALGPELAASRLARWGLPVRKDLRGLFTGAETGSRKNDAYRWAIREYLARGKCSAHLFCLYEDSFSARDRGDLGYAVTRDWAAKNRAFVFDLSPWGDERPGDDPGQKPGTDLATYRMILEEMLRQSAGKQMTEMAGFFAFAKYSHVAGHESVHEPVPTEWETVWLISPYNCYQNTVASDCYNGSFQSQAPRSPLRQGRPAKRPPLEKKTYICILMADYDSATPLYAFLPDHWDDPGRGKMPLCWGIDPNLLETYPDIIAHLYATASPNDSFASDASAAGYMNPNRVAPEHLPLFVRHNAAFFAEADMTLAPMVLDWDQPSAAVKDAFARFAPDGLATIVMDLHGKGGRGPEPHVWKGMPVMELINDACNFAGVDRTAEILSAAITARGGREPGFHFFRIVWTRPTAVIETIEALRRKRPDLAIEVLDPHTFFALFAEHRRAAGGPKAAGKDGRRPKVAAMDAARRKDWLARWERNIVADSRNRYCDKESGEEIGWLIMPFLEGFYWGYEATGDAKWADMLVDWADSWIRRGVKEPDGYIGWPTTGAAGTKVDDLDSFDADSLLGEAMGLRPIVAMAAEILATPALRAKYGPKAEGYLALAEKVFEKWDRRGAWRETKDGAIPVVLPFGLDTGRGAWTAGHEKRNAPGAGFSHPNNKANHVARWLLALYDATEKPIYRERAEKWFRLLKSRLAAKGDGTYRIWNYWEPAGPWDRKPDGGPKHWVGVHPNGGYYSIDVEGIVDAYEHGVVFTGEDIDRLIATARAEKRTWAALAPYDEAIRKAFEETLKPDGWDGLRAAPWWLALQARLEPAALR